MVSIGESTNWKTRQDVHSKYRALKSYIECLNHESDGFKKIQKLVKSSETRLENQTTEVENSTVKQLLIFLATLLEIW